MKLDFQLTNFRILIILIPFIAILQHFILLEHLRYGFRDMDWVFVKDYKELLPLSINTAVEGWKKWGVYTYQMFYIGIPTEIFGINFKALHLTTHFFKLLSTITVFPLVLIISKNKLMATVSTLLYATAYPAVGAMFSVVTSGNYLAVAVMNIFLTYYWYITEFHKYSVVNLVTMEFLMLSTLFLSTERMYPLIGLILIAEAVRIIRERFSKRVLSASLKKGIFFLGPVIIGIFFSPAAATQFLGNTTSLIHQVQVGNWQLLLTPLASFGSLFLPQDYWKFFGSPRIDNFTNYFVFFLGGPLIIFGISVGFLSSLLSRNFVSFIRETMIFFYLFSILVYILASHHLKIETSLQMHFDPGYIVVILIGTFVLSVMAVSIRNVLTSAKTDRILLAIITGLFVAFLFIVLTWMVSDIQLVFMGPHRYLTVPAIGSSIFIAGIFILAFNRIRSFKGNIAWLIFLLLIPIAIINSNVIYNFFENEVDFAGMDGSEQTRMKNKLWSYLPNFSDTEPSFFYFDESADYQNGYFHESTILAGFNTWMLFRGNNIVDGKFSPAMLRTNLLCPEERRNCTDKVLTFIVSKNGKNVISYNNLIFYPENFYAFRLENKDVINITEEVKKSIGI